MEILESTLSVLKIVNKIQVIVFYIWKQKSNWIRMLYYSRANRVIDNIYSKQVWMKI